MPTLYVSDLDGTLLNDEATLSTYSRDRLNELIAEGVAFTVASARSLESIRMTLVGLELRLPVIDFDGAFISDVDSGEHFTTQSLQWKVADRIVEQGSEAELSPFYSTVREGVDYLFPARQNNDGIESHLRIRVEKGDPRLQDDPWDDRSREHHDLICLAYLERKHPLEELVKTIHSDQELYSHLSMHLIEDAYMSGWYWLLCNDRSAQKHLALEKLRTDFVDGVEELVVFGDNVNDLGMLKMADRSYAVANAVESVRTVATAVIGSNQSDAVVKQIQQEVASQ